MGGSELCIDIVRVGEFGFVCFEVRKVIFEFGFDKIVFRRFVKEFKDLIKWEISLCFWGRGNWWKIYIVEVIRGWNLLVRVVLF